MESWHRKRRGDGGEGEGEGDDGRLPSRPRADDGVRSATDDEVEEFFTILRQLREASRCLTARPKAAAPVSDYRSSRWSPEFAWEDFAGLPDAAKEEHDSSRGAAAAGNCPPAAEKEVERAAETASPRLLDLNADPEEEGLAAEEANPRRGEVTAACARARD